MNFVDSSFWIARFLSQDRRHKEAVDLDRSTRTHRLVTSNEILGETWTFLRKRTGHERALAWLDGVQRSDVRVDHIDERLEHEAWAWLRVHDERPYSFVDATSFALMRKLRIREALAFDGDFAAAGFVELRP